MKPERAPTIACAYFLPVRDNQGKLFRKKKFERVEQELFAKWAACTVS